MQPSIGWRTKEANHQLYAFVKYLPGYGKFKKGMGSAAKVLDGYCYLPTWK